MLAIAEKYVGEIWKEFNTVDSMNFKKFAVTALAPVKKPTTREEADRKRLKEMSELPDKYHEQYTEVFWESYKEELVGEVYEYAVYEKMKEVFTEFYIDDILELDSDYLRYFDRGIYLMCSRRFVDGIYELI